MLAHEYPHLVQLSSIGNTFEGNEQRLIILTENSTKSIPFESKEAIFVNGAHHARELTSVSMVYYLLLKLIYNHEKGD